MITIHDESRSVHISARLARELTHEELIAVFQQNRDRRALLDTVTMKMPQNKYEREADRLLRLKEIDDAIRDQEDLRDRCIKSKSRGCLAETLEAIERLKTERYQLTKPPVPVMHVRGK